MLCRVVPCREGDWVTQPGHLPEGSRGGEEGSSVLTGEGRVACYEQDGVLEGEQAWAGVCAAEKTTDTGGVTRGEPLARTWWEL